MNQTENAKVCAVCELGFRERDVSSIKLTPTLLNVSVRIAPNFMSDIVLIAVSSYTAHAEST
jgi:hypothetical protein